MNTPGKIKDEKRSEILSITAKYGASNVRLFGSIARGENRPESDIDILVNLEEGRSLLDLIALKQDLEDLCHCKVDVLTEHSISPYIRDKIIKEATNL